MEQNRHSRVRTSDNENPQTLNKKTDTGSGARSTYNRTTSQGLLTATGFNSTTTDCLLTRAVYRI